MSAILPYGILIVLPLLGGIVSLLARKTSFVATATIGLGLIGSFQVFFSEAWFYSWDWLPSVALSFRVDHISGLLILLVYLISFLVHLFSHFYMDGDEGISRYYFKLGFFTTSMLGLLAADSLILLFVFWELVGFSSYLLIGFWFSDPEKARSAKIAFIVNRVADVFLFIAIILLVFDLQVERLSDIGVSPVLPLLVSVFLAIGAFGKSAQFPFSAWLKQAMAGPTPVSALIHAATMVTAGVYLLIRFSPVLAPEALMLCAIIGGVTAFMAAFAAITQTDIKGVLAYSTISQLGFMTMGIGAGAADASLFHLWTHAFFKAGLFLAAGSVIHFMHHRHARDPQNMIRMGGLKKFLPYTYLAFILCGAALAGIPLFSGFLSKEGILGAVLDKLLAGDPMFAIVGLLGFAAALMTPFYIFRQVFLVFYRKPRIATSDTLEPRLTVRFPLVFLGLASLWVLFTFNPFDPHGWWLREFAGLPETQIVNAGLTVAISVFLTLIALSAAYFRFFRKRILISVSPVISGISLNGWYLDAIYDRISVGFNGLCKFAADFDSKVIDATVKSIGIGGVVIAKISGWFDRHIVDGLIGLFTAILRFFGKAFTRIQAPMVQFQIAFAILILIVVLFWVQNI